MPNSWKAEVIADSSGTWSSNALRFATEAEALASGQELFRRWFAVREVRATPSDDPVTDRFVDGRNVRIAEQEKQS